MFRKLLLACGLALCAATAQAATITDASFEDSSNGMLMGFSSTQSGFAQTFTAENTGRLERIEVLLQTFYVPKFGLSGTGPATVGFSSTLGAFPGAPNFPGPTLASRNVDHADVGVPADWVSIDLSSENIFLTAGNRYGISVTGPLGTGYGWRGSNDSGAYAGGDLFGLSNLGLPTPTNGDLAFRVFVTPGSGGPGNPGGEPPTAPVPLPAAGFLLIAGLGGLGLIRRKG